MALIDEIKAKCTAAQLVARQDDVITAAVNVGRTKTVPIPRSIFAMWCGSTGLRAVIQDAAITPANPLRSVALTILDFLQGGVASSIDMSLTENRQMLAAFQAHGGVTEEQIASLNTLAVVSDPVSVSDVSDALNAGGY